MRKKRIKFDDRIIIKLIYLSIIIGLTYVKRYIISSDDFTQYVLISVVIIISLVLLMSSMSYGLTFNYRREVVKILTTINYEIIKMDEIKTMEFIEVEKNRVKKCTFLSSIEPAIGLFPKLRKNVYRNGKIFKFIITKKNGKIIEIYYGNLFKAKSKGKVARKEMKIRKAIKEFNEFKS